MSGVPNPHRVYRVGNRSESDVDLIRVLSDEARVTRKPGQTLHSRLNELRQECAA